MLFQKKNQKKDPKYKKLEYDKENQKPILKCSICNGEQVAGFKDNRTGKFHEVMFIRDEKDLQTFKDMYDLYEIEKEY